MDRSISIVKFKWPPLFFIPSLYMMEAIPYGIILMLSTVMYKQLGVSNTQITFWTSLLQFPWVWKLIWGPLIDSTSTKRKWILLTQTSFTLIFWLLASALLLPNPIGISITLIGIAALCSAFHDVAADGFYILSLKSKEQALFSGVRNTAYRIGLLLTQGGLIIFAGILEKKLPIQTAWSYTFVFAAALCSIGVMWHLKMLPYPKTDHLTSRPLRSATKDALSSFFKKPEIQWSIAFLLTYRLGEAQLLRISAPFLMESRSLGGLALETTLIGSLYGVFGVICLLAGGLIGGFLGSIWPLRSLMLPFWAALNVPNILYLYLSLYQPTSILPITTSIAIEQFGYGFGFTGYMLFMLTLAKEKGWETSHYAICTGLMALGVLVPGLWSGWLQETIGYSLFFGWIILSSFPALFLINRLPLDS